jgi:hypothetical protein
LPRAVKPDAREELNMRQTAVVASDPGFHPYRKV